MGAGKDSIDTTTERASERMNFRTKPHIKKAIQRAAALRGLDDSVFTMNAAYASALETIEAHDRTRLAPLDHAVFFEALDEAPAPTAALRAAFDSYQKRVTVK